MELKARQEEIATLRETNSAIQMELKAKQEEVATLRETNTAVQRESQKHEVDMSAMDLENRALQNQIATLNSAKQEEIECLQKRFQHRGPEREMDDKKCRVS